MSTSPEADFDLEQVFLPAWAKESPKANRFENFRGEPERDRDRRSDRRDRPPRRPQGDRPSGKPPFAGRPGQPPRGPRPPRRDGRDPRDDRRDRPERPAPPPPLPELQLVLVAEEHGVDLLARQIRVTGRAYPLFEIAQMILAKPERHTLTFTVKKKPDGTPVQPLFLCALDETLWLSEDDAVRHVLDRHFATFYQPERTAIDPPRGVYTFVAQCSMSGIVLGPPNHHDYQNQLRRLHAEKFSRMHFEMFKSKVRIVRDDAVVKKWIEDQSWKTEYVCLNMPESVKLPSREEVEKHFRQVHLANIIKPVETHRITGTSGRGQRDRELNRLIRQRWDEQRRFPMQVATTLSQQFASRGLQFFKVNRSITHVAVARPRYLDLEATPVSEGVRRIVEFVNAHPRCTRKQLVEALAPIRSVPVVPVVPVAAGEGAPPPPVGAPPEMAPEVAAVLTDLHWLAHQGHVIEFANGVVETAKKPAPRPEKPAAKQTEPSAADATTPASPADAAPADLAAEVVIDPGSIATATEVAGEAVAPAAEVATTEASAEAAHAEAPSMPAPEVQPHTPGEPTKSA
jgi:hypothetical protein